MITFRKKQRKIAGTITARNGYYHTIRGDDGITYNIDSPKKYRLSDRVFIFNDMIIGKAGFKNPSSEILV